MNHNRPIRRVPKPRAVKPAPLPAHAPVTAPMPTAQEMGAWFNWALVKLPPTWESGGHE